MTVTPSRLSLEDRYLKEQGLLHITGIQAMVRLPMDQHRADTRRGLRTASFISGYPGSPLGGYDMELARNRHLLDSHRIVFQPGVNEEVAATAVAGSQLAATRPEVRHDGVVGIWYGKAPGLDRASDALRHSNMVGAHPRGGVVALVGDDPSAKSSTMPNASEAALSGLGMPVLYPADAQDLLDLGRHGIAMSRASGLWVGLKVVTDVADGSGTVEVHPDRVVPRMPDLEVDGRPFRHEVTGMLLQPMVARLEHSLYRARPEIALRYAAANELNRITRRGPQDRVGIVAAGKTYLDVCQALSILGLDEQECERRGLRLLKLGMISPLEPGIVEEFAEGLIEVLVVEEKRSFVETALKDRLYGRSGAPIVMGKTTPDGTVLFSADGELDPDLIAERLARRLLPQGHWPSVEAWAAARESRPREPNLLPLLTRTPYFCSGCPHSSSLKTLQGTLTGTGTGCSSLAVLMDPEQVGDVAVLMQMGGEGAQWIGMAPFLDREHMVQNIGDGTFHHSGSLVIRAAVAAGVNITYKLLYNSAVAMTGGQQAVGGMSVRDLTTVLKAEGVARIIVTTDDPRRYKGVRLPDGVQVFHRDRLLEAQETLAGTPGTTVLVHDQECATEKRRKRKRGRAEDPPTRVFINERVCEGCGDCGRASNCLSVLPVDTDYGRKTQIHQASCNKDYSCLEGDCPSFVTVLPGAARAARAVAPALGAAMLPPASPRVGVEEFTVRITGVGGTGVVTVAQIIAIAARMAGRHVRAMDQTGMAQKGGAVVSDLKVSAEPLVAAAKVAAGECDLYLGCDLLVAAEAKNLAVAGRQRTLAVVSTAEVPTGQMVVDPRVGFPDVVEVEQRIRSATRADEGVFLDTRELTQALLGDDECSNVLLLGIAYQVGALPLSPEVVEEAIIVNGAAVEANLQAFRRGRQAVADPDALSAALEALQPQTTPPPPIPAEVQAVTARVRARPGSKLAELVARRAPDLMAYQNLRYAEAYVQTVEKARAAEAETVPGLSNLTEAVAQNLYKLMAYKDEYEVARLCVDPALQADLEAEFGAGYRYTSYRLHPPVLRSLGMKKKLSLGTGFRPVLRGLYAMRRVRGTRLDPFGYAYVRGVERELVEEYRSVLDEMLSLLTSENHATAVEIASLPDLVRGYEQIKLDNVAVYRQQLGDLMASYREPVRRRRTTNTSGS